MTSIRRSALGAVVLTALVGLTLSQPASVAACLCMGEAEGDVVFTGRVVDSPNEHILLHDIWIPDAGVYTFDVESVIRGDPLDGRVHSGSGDCRAVFEVGATYLVHAQIGNEPGVPLVAGTCMAGEYLEPPPPLTAIGAWALALQGVLVLGWGLLLLMAAAGYLWYRRRTSTDIRPTRSD